MDWDRINQLKGSKDPDLEEIAEIMKAEAKTPALLNCKATEIKEDGTKGIFFKEYPVKNEIDQSIDSYHPAGVVTKYIEKMDKSEFLALEGMTEDIAQRIIAQRKLKNNRFSTYKDLNDSL